MATHHPNITVPIMAPPPSQPSTPPYSESFENEAMERLINLPSASNQRLNPNASPAPVAPAERPVPINDPRRAHPLAATNISLTEPGGSVYGGPGIPPETLRAEGQEHVNEKGYTGKNAMNEHLAKQIQAQEEEAKERAWKRYNAIQHNVKIDEEIRQLEQNYEMEKRGMEKRFRAAADE